MAPEMILHSGKALKAGNHTRNHDLGGSDFLRDIKVQKFGNFMRRDPVMMMMMYGCFVFDDI